MDARRDFHGVYCSPLLEVSPEDNWELGARLPHLRRLSLVVGNDADPLSQTERLTTVDASDLCIVEVLHFDSSHVMASSDLVPWFENLLHASMNSLRSITWQVASIDVLPMLRCVDKLEYLELYVHPTYESQHRFLGPLLPSVRWVSLHSLVLDAIGTFYPNRTLVHLGRDEFPGLRVFEVRIFRGGEILGLKEFIERLPTLQTLGFLSGGVEKYECELASLNPLLYITCYAIDLSILNGTYKALTSFHIVVTNVDGIRKGAEGIAALKDVLMFLTRRHGSFPALRKIHFKLPRPALCTAGSNLHRLHGELVERMDVEIVDESGLPVFSF